MEQAEWANRKAQEVRDKRKRSDLEKQARLLDDRQRTEAAPELWKEFVSHIEERVKAFNDEIGEQALTMKHPSSNRVSVGAHDFVTEISAELDSRLFIRCMVVSTSIEFRISVLHGQVTLSTGGAGTFKGEAISTDAAAEQFLNSIITVL
jgi:hypothetical protein